MPAVVKKPVYLKSYLKQGSPGVADRPFEEYPAP
jgi:hypothetical protein